MPDDHGRPDAALPDWRELFDASPFGTLIFTPDLILLGCNAAHARTSGMASDALRGRFMFDVFPKNPDEGGPDTEETIRASVARVIETGAADEPPIQKHDLPREGGGFEPRYWRIIHSPVLRGSEVVAIRQDSWDVTAAVRESERQETLRRVAGKLAGIAFWELDVATDRILHSPEFDTLFGFPAEDGTGVERPFRSYAERFHEDDRATIEAAVADLMHEEIGAVRQFEYRIVRPDGEVRHALVRGEAALGRDGRRVLTGITLDVTDLHAQEARLAALLEEKQALLEEVNHRVKNSLQLVSSILKLEARRAAPGEGERLASAAARVQSVASVHASLYHQEDVRAVDMRAHLRELCAHLAASMGADARGIAMGVDVAEVSLPVTQAIPLSLIVNELVTNAFKYAFPEEVPVGARVDVSLRALPGGGHVLVVCDNGGGDGTPGPSGASLSDGTGAAPSAPAGGLGTQLITTLARQIGGDATEERNDGWSTRIEFGR